MPRAESSTSVCSCMYLCKITTATTLALGDLPKPAHTKLNLDALKIIYAVQTSKPRKFNNGKKIQKIYCTPIKIPSAIKLIHMIDRQAGLKGNLSGFKTENYDGGSKQSLQIG
jgi:hypothetical protein